MMKKVAILFLIFTLLLAMSAVVLAQDSIAVGDTVEGQLNNEEHTYVFSASADDTVVISLESSDFDTLLTVTNAGGMEVGRDDDGGDGTNSRLVFTVPADGTYTVVVTGFGGPQTGAYVLSLSGLTITPIVPGQTVDVTFDGGMNIFYFVLEGKAGEVFDIIGDSGQQIDTKLSLLDESRREIARDDDSGPGTDPYIRRVVLPTTGAYTLTIETLYSLDTGSVSVSVKPVELPQLGAEPQTFTLNDQLSVERFGLMVVPGKTYVIHLSTINGTGSPSLNIEQPDGYTIVWATASSVSGFSVEFLSSDEGMLIATIEDYLPVTYEISITEE